MLSVKLIPINLTDKAQKTLKGKLSFKVFLCFVANSTEIANFKVSRFLLILKAQEGEDKE